MAMDTDTRRADLVRALRRERPTELRVVLLDGEEKEIAIPGKRKRWSTVVDMLSKLSWLRLECLDPRGKCIAIVENDEPADELEDIGDSYGGQVHQLTALMLRAQDVALKRNAEQQRQSNDLVLQLCTTLMKRLDALERGFESNLRLAQKFALAASDEDDALLSTSAIQAVLPMLAAKVMSPVTPPTPKKPDGTS